MKLSSLKAAFLCMLLLCGSLSAQIKKTSLTVLNIDAKGVSADPGILGDMVRIEIEKLDSFDVLDRYDVQYVIEKNKLNISNCYGKTCLTEIGEIIHSEKMFSGTIEHLGKVMVVSFRLIDTKEKKIEKTYVREFIYLPEEIQNIVKLSVAEMFGRKIDKMMLDKLSKRNEFDNAYNNPNKERLRLDGPRMGCVFYTGELRDRIMEAKGKGGFDAYPVMFQFGYQFEKQYLNEGKVQALFEFIPLITGLDQGYFIPSLTVLHGVRSNVHGWEIAFGPTFNLIPMARGYYDAAGNWQLERRWNAEASNSGKENPFEVVDRMDSRGDYMLHAGFILAAGRTFKSGKLNVPVNVFVVPGRDGWKIGMSFGFNAKNR